MNGFLAGIIRAQRGETALLRPRPLPRFASQVRPGPLGLEPETEALAPPPQMAADRSDPPTAAEPRPGALLAPAPPHLPPAHPPAGPAAVPPPRPAGDEGRSRPAPGPAADAAPALRPLRLPATAPRARVGPPADPAPPPSRREPAPAADQPGPPAAAPVDVDAAPALVPPPPPPARPRRPATRAATGAGRPGAPPPGGAPDQVVHVTIGRVEIRATTPERRRPEADGAGRPRGVMTLAEYVARRESAR